VPYPVKGASFEVAPILVSIYQPYKPKKDKMTDIDMDEETPALGGGLVPPGISANADIVVARRAAESASVRNVRDMVIAPGR
jgi:hypothetical protein